MCQGLERSWHIRMPVKMGKESVYSKKHITQKEYEHYRKYGYDGEGQLMVEEDGAFRKIQGIYCCYI